ncbi:MAG: phosphonoacetaldehyde hydrolase [Pseudomonadota bacterium]
MKYKAVVFDWAGTMVDFGSFAPMGAFVEAFSKFGVRISTDQARGPMGMAKRDHIAAILSMPDVFEKFRGAQGREPAEGDITAIYDVFVPLNEKVAGKFADLVPGASEMVAELRRRGMKIGSTTGYTRSIMQYVLPVAAGQGYQPDNLVCSDEVAKGRPAPDAMLRCFEELGIADPSTVIKVDDTEPGIGEGKNAGCLAVGVTLSGNFAGKTSHEIGQMDELEINAIRMAAGEKLLSAGADHVIDTVAKLPALIDHLERQLRNGQLDK